MWHVTYRLTGCSPFLGDSEQETIQNVISGEYEYPEDNDEEDDSESAASCSVSGDAKEFISSLLLLNQRYMSMHS